MGKYYYLVSSLPTLRFGEKPPLGIDAFIRECEKWMDGMALSRIKGLELENIETNKDDSGFVREWKEFNGLFKDRLAEMRNKRKTAKKIGAKELQDKLEGKNPLEKEKALEKIRWDFLDGAEHNFYFDGENLVIYKLKLQIINRISGFNKDKGKEKFADICEERE